jgi:hypothetical protein
VRVLVAVRDLVAVAVPTRVGVADALGEALRVMADDTTVPASSSQGGSSMQPAPALASGGVKSVRTMYTATTGATRSLGSRVQLASVNCRPDRGFSDAVGGFGPCQHPSIVRT